METFAVAAGAKEKNLPQILLAVAVASGVVAAGSVLQAALGQATASLAAERAKVPVVDLALNKISSF